MLEQLMPPETQRLCLIQIGLRKQLQQRFRADFAADEDHRVVVAADVGGIERQIWRVLDATGFPGGKAFLDGLPVRAGK